MNTDASTISPKWENGKRDVAVRDNVLPHYLQSLILSSKADSDICQFGVREILERIYEHEFEDPDLVRDVGEFSRALVHAALNNLPSQVALHKERLQRVLALEDSRVMVRKAQAVGLTCKLFGELDTSMHYDLRLGRRVTFLGMNSSYHWVLEMAGKSFSPIPVWALENLTRFRMAGGEFDEAYLGHEVEWRPFRKADPVLLVKIPESLFLIEVARWV